MEIIYAPKDKKSSLEITGGVNPITSFREMRFTDNQLDVCIPFLQRINHLFYIQLKMETVIPVYKYF